MGRDEPQLASDSPGRDGTNGLEDSKRLIGLGPDRLPTVRFGTDLNSTGNELVQPIDPARSGGGMDQSLNFADVMIGGPFNDVMFGAVGDDVMFGQAGDDVLIGGTEAGTQPNRDRAFGGDGDDVFVWQPGDGSDYFDGGLGGADAVVFGILGGDPDGKGVPEFDLEDDVDANGNGGFEEPFIAPETHLPAIDVVDAPGFCEVIDASTSATAATQLAALNLTHLVRFVNRDARNAFERGLQSTDNGVRVTLHLRNVEFVVCATREGGEQEVIDLRYSPPRLVSDRALSAATRRLLVVPKAEAGGN